MGSAGRAAGLAAAARVWMGVCLAGLWLAGPGVGPALGQEGGPSGVSTLEPGGGFSEPAAPAAGSDEAVIAEARHLIAVERFKDAEKALTRFIKRVERTDNAWLADAYLLRGDAKLGQRDEFDALYDYESVIREFSESPLFVDAVERELDIATMYINGLRRKFLGLRIEGSRTTGEELLIRVQERLPSSAVAETAAIRLADHYYGRRDMRLAAEMYGIFVKNFPESEHATRARINQIYANIARFKGPRYDSSSLIDARSLIDDFQARYPAEAERAGVTVALESRIDESAAQRMLETAAWYLRRRDEPAAKISLERVIRRHPRSAAAQTALRTLEARGWLPVGADDAEGAVEAPANAVEGSAGAAGDGL